MPIPEEIINEIKYRNDIEAVISPYVTLKRRGKNLVGLCPFHNEKTPSFTVYPENGSFYCFGCGVGGDVFTFVKLIENLDYIDAIKLLAEKSGITVEQESYDNSFQKVKDTVYAINRETALFYHNYLMSPQGKWALDYLLGRGLTLNTIKHFGLGAAPDNWDSLLNHLKSKGFSVNDMLTANVISKSQKENQKESYYDRFHKRVMFPIINVRGRVVAFSGRAMPGEDTTAKYVNTADTPVYKKSENLFGMNFAKNHCDEKIILVEGNMDVISLHQAGFENTVAALGTAFTEQQAKILSRYTKEIVLTLDADAAGQKAVRRAGEVLKNTGLNVRVVVVPEGKDPDEFIKKNGASKFAKLIDNSLTETEYKLTTAVGGIDILSDKGKLDYLLKAAEIIAESNDIVTRDFYIGKICDSYSVSRTALEAKVNEIRSKKVKVLKKKEFESIVNKKFSKTDVNPDRHLHPAAAAAEETVIAILLKHSDFFDTAYESLKPDDMITGLNRRIYSVICESILGGREPDISTFGTAFNDSEMGYIVSLLNGERAEKNPLTVLKDSITVLKNEKMRISSTDTQSMSLDDWAENMKKIAESKKRGN